MIAAGQVSIYRELSATSSKVKLTNEQGRRRYKQDIAVAKQLSLIAVTDFLCWFPICVMGIMAQDGVPISDSAYAWSAVVAMPVNSSINPVLYTLRSLFASMMNTFKMRFYPDASNRSSGQQTIGISDTYRRK